MFSGHSTNPGLVPIPDNCSKEVLMRTRLRVLGITAATAVAAVAVPLVTSSEAHAGPLHRREPRRLPRRRRRLRR